MNRSTIRARLKHNIVMSVFALESPEWAAGRYSLSMVDKPWHDAGTVLTMPAPVKFNTHHRKNTIQRHDHIYYELMYVYSGEITHVFDDEIITMHHGDLLIMAPGEFHTVEPCGEDLIAMNIMCEKQFMETEIAALLTTCAPVADLLSGKSNRQHIFLPSRADASSRSIAELLISEFLDPDIASLNLIKSYLGALINSLYRVYGTNDGHVYVKPENGKGDISYIFSYIQNHFATVTLGELARVFGYDNYYLSKVIRKNLGTTFIDLKHYFCVEEAKRLLKSTNMTVREISEHVGFNNMSYFYKIFAESCGVTPAEYRIKEEN
ncbi:MAG: helix-turn-helix domain-containing protein [Clostridia bacterium]|nr:helix-turn-helix domain-containing protein [Clostridia bacterium]